MRIRTWTSGTSAAIHLIMLAALIGAPVAAQDRTETYFRQARDYTVRIRTQISTPFYEDVRGSFEGAGFLVDAKRRWVLTNAHVVGQSPSTVQVAFVDGTFRPARKVYVDSFTDVAVLEVAPDDLRHSVPTIDWHGTPEVGEPVGAFGHPLGMPFTGTRGIVSGRTSQFLNDLIQVDAKVDHGNSGGPVISLRSGRIVGIATAGAGNASSDRINLATPMRDVGRILELLRAGVSPDPAHMAFSLLVDEDGNHTLEVGCTYDAARWPFEPGDRILAVGREREAVGTLTELVTALRGRTGAVPLQVVRDGHEIEAVARPILRPSIDARRGVSLDGAMIARVSYEDSAGISVPAMWIVQYVEEGSAAQSLDFQEQDIIQSIDGRTFDDLESLVSYLDERRGQGVRVVLRRPGGTLNRWFTWHVRELPDADLGTVGPGSELAGGGP